MEDSAIDDLLFDEYQRETKNIPRALNICGPRSAFLRLVPTVNAQKKFKERLEHLKHLDGANEEKTIFNSSLKRRKIY